MTDCASLFASVLLLVVVLIMLRCNKKSSGFMVGDTPYGLDPKALAAVTGSTESMGNPVVGAHIDNIAMAKTRAHEFAGRVDTEGNPKLLALMMDPRYKQYGAGRGGIYHY